MHNCFSKAVMNSNDTALNDWITAEGVETSSCDLNNSTYYPISDILKGTIQLFSQRDRNTNRNLSHVRRSSVQSRHLLHASDYHLRQIAWLIIEVHNSTDSLIY